MGTRDRSEFELDVAAALRRGRVLDAMLRSAQVLPPRGVYRGTHAHFNRLDADRRLATARRLNTE